MFERQGPSVRVADAYWVVKQVSNFEHERRDGG